VYFLYWFYHKVAMTLILTKTELERIRAEARIGSTVTESKEYQRRAELKRLSNEKVKHWPNTLEALRKKKESFIKEREETEELRRQEQDREV
jgi:Zn-finger nucleic acid-binding protein